MRVFYWHSDSLVAYFRHWLACLNNTNNCDNNEKKKNEREEKHEEAEEK